MYFLVECEFSSPEVCVGCVSGIRGRFVEEDHKCLCKHSGKDPKNERKLQHL